MIRSTGHSQLLTSSIRCKKKQTPIPSHSISYCSSNSRVQNSVSDSTSVGCMDELRRLVSGIITFYLSCITLVGGARGDPDLPMRCACEDVSQYYASVDHKVWEALKVLDASDIDHPELHQMYFLMRRVEIYSAKVVLKHLARKPEGWNREHLWPRSYGLPDGPSLTDLHIILAADVNVNSSVGNKYYGECLANSTHCVKPANREAAINTETDKVRGDIARALMYMVVCYGFNQSDGSPNLHLSDSPSIEKGKMGLLSTLLKWNEHDPPSKEEQLSICQCNMEASYSRHSECLKAWINEFYHDDRGRDQNEFVEIIVGPSVDATKLKIALYNGANGRVYSSLSLIDIRVFHVTYGGSGLCIQPFTPLQNGPSDDITLISTGDGGHTSGSVCIL